jgi:hypothetical protein
MVHSTDILSLPSPFIIPIESVYMDSKTMNVIIDLDIDEICNTVWLLFTKYFKICWDFQLTMPHEIDTKSNIYKKQRRAYLLAVFVLFSAKWKPTRAEAA